MKLYIESGFFHHMNKISLDYIIQYLNINIVSNIGDADVVYSPSQYIDTEKYPNKKFIFGPHFSVFPNEITRKLSNKYNNTIYIQPSQPSVDTWVNEFNFNNIPVISFPFPLRLEDYSVFNKEGDRILVYYKSRTPDDLNFLISFLDKKSDKYDLIKYGSYKENDYQNKLNNCKFVIWLGAHESQGFALQSVMCKNIPLLVWGVKLRSQQYNCQPEFLKVKSEVSTVPYWDNTCGELFFNKEELESSYNKLRNNLDSYNPRQFIIDNLSVEKCSERFLKILNEMNEK